MTSEETATFVDKFHAVFETCVERSDGKIKVTDFDTMAKLRRSDGKPDWPEIERLYAERCAPSAALEGARGEKVGSIFGMPVVADPTVPNDAFEFRFPDGRRVVHSVSFNTESDRGRRMREAAEREAKAVVGQSIDDWIAQKSTAMWNAEQEARRRFAEARDKQRQEIWDAFRCRLAEGEPVFHGVDLARAGGDRSVFMRTYWDEARGELVTEELLQKDVYKTESPDAENRPKASPQPTLGPSSSPEGNHPPRRLSPFSDKASPSITEAARLGTGGEDE